MLMSYETNGVGFVTLVCFALLLFAVTAKNSVKQPGCSLLASRAWFPSFSKKKDRQDLGQDQLLPHQFQLQNQLNFSNQCNQAQTSNQ